MKKLITAIMVSAIALFSAQSTAWAAVTVQQPNVDRTWSNQTPTNGYKALVQYFTVNQLPTAEGWFDSTQFQYIDANGAVTDGGYFGWQSQLFMPNGSGQTGVIFSIFHGTSANNTGCANGQAYSGTEGGVPFYSFHCVLNVVAGHRYLMYITKDSPTTNFVRWYYRDMNVDAHSFQLATIGVPSNWTGIKGFVNNWIEHYSPNPLSSCPTTPAIATFEQPYTLDWSNNSVQPASNSTRIDAGDCTSHIDNLGSGTYKLTAAG